MSSYEVMKEYGLGNQEISTSPAWVIAVLRLRFPASFSRNAHASFSKSLDEGVQLRGETLIISSDAIQVNTTSTKSNHMTQMQAVLLPGRNYVTDILPGDHVFVWMVNDQEKAQDLMARIKAGQPCNKFNDGFKFQGRCGSPRKLRRVLEDGKKVMRYSLNALGFSELDAKIFYDLHLAEKFKSIGQYFARIGVQLDHLIDTSHKGRTGIDINVAIVQFLDLFLGKGVKASIGRGNDDSRLKSTAGLEAPFSFILPSEVGALIGKTEKSKASGCLAYADCLEVIYGVQRYTGFSAEEQSALIDAGAESDADWHSFSPDGTHDGGSRRFTGTDMLGIFTPIMSQFTDRSVWTILHEYLNPAINEMYTTLRVNSFGAVVPTLVVRQLPFSSPLVNTSTPYTRFLDLPRWKIDPLMEKDSDLGRSDALRINFVHAYGDTGADHLAPLSSQIVHNPPVRDDMDIARSGLQSHMATIACAPADVKNGSATKWMEILSDILMGQHLTFTGTLEVTGIQAPICVGDNLEFEDVVYHIETVSHNCMLNSEGKKSFRTTLSLSHGVSTVESATDLGIFAGIEDGAMAALDPGITNDNRDPANNETGLTGGLGDFNISSSGES